ncbi:D-glycero-beta-D-manno-heptose-7-phosphate kinase, partial [candidate division WOR-3 bacterium]|nr:D-glycero-beta-D-manno-heptose-7-phosphate kinase [candidate division WOR-3 bacterium]
AANVAHNLNALGATVVPIGVIGDDAAGEKLTSIFNDLGVSCDGIFTDLDRKTTQKTRIIAHSQHVVRVDREKKTNIGEKTRQKIKDFARKTIPDCDAILFEDYDKGLLNCQIIEEILNFALSLSKPVFVDPKFDNFFCYKNVKLFKPNGKELEKATGIKCENEGDLTRAALEIQEKQEIEHLLLTLGEKGMVIFTKGENEPLKIPTKAREVYDVSGAGDTVIATVCLSMLSEASIEESAVIGSHAAAVQLKKIGAQTVSVQEILESFKNHEY